LLHASLHFRESRPIHDMHAPGLELYENIARATQRMVEAARALDWEALGAAQRDCLELVQRAGSLGAGVLDAEARARKAQLMRTMLRNDAELRALAHPELARLDALLQASGNRC
jgi:flagellar protein FliT